MTSLTIGKPSHLAFNPAFGSQIFHLVSYDTLLLSGLDFGLGSNQLFIHHRNIELESRLISERQTSLPGSSRPAPGRSTHQAG